MLRTLLFALCSLLWLPSLAQQGPGEVYTGRGPFSRADSLHGALTPIRKAFDVKGYNLAVDFDLAARRLSGRVRIHLTAVKDLQRLQFDLHPSFELGTISWAYENFPSEAIRKKNIEREARAIFLNLGETVLKGSQIVVEIAYSGPMPVAQNAPWDGGFSFEKDKQGRPWVAVSCQSDGASLWWPCKDHLSDEPDSVTMAYTVPQGLMAVGNGRLMDDYPAGEDKQTYVWKVRSTINPYNVTVYIGAFEHWREAYRGTEGQLDLDYYVLPENLETAKGHFQQVKPMLQVYELFFGPYPFYVDGYKLVETPYWGMEHQSAVAYGNRYENNAYGFDFIIIHETGHEWFGNSISVTDHGDLWVHESFTTYMEAVYLEAMQGPAATQQYLDGQRRLIRARAAVQGPSEVYFDDWPAADMYYKGTWMLHTMRNMLARRTDGEKAWFDALKQFCMDYRHRSTNSQQVINYFCTKLGEELRPIFNQYLYYKAVPIMEYELVRGEQQDRLYYRLVAGEPAFALPLEVYIGGQRFVVNATTETQVLDVGVTPLESTVQVNDQQALVMPRRNPNLAPQ